MYNKDMLIGILLSSTKMQLTVRREPLASIGYTTKLALLIRGDMEFIQAVRRSLMQHQITCVVSHEESKARPRPILRIGGIKNLIKIVSLVPPLPDFKGEWKGFREVVELMNTGGHRTAEGLERILEIKGVI